MGHLRIERSAGSLSGCPGRPARHDPSRAEREDRTLLDLLVGQASSPEERAPRQSLRMDSNHLATAYGAVRLPRTQREEAATRVVKTCARRHHFDRVGVVLTGIRRANRWSTREEETEAVLWDRPRASNPLSLARLPMESLLHSTGAVTGNRTRILGVALRDSSVEPSPLGSDERCGDVLALYR